MSFLNLARDITQIFKSDTFFLILCEFHTCPQCILIIFTPTSSVSALPGHLQDSLTFSKAVLLSQISAAYVFKSVHECVQECIHECVHECVQECVHECM